MPAIAKKLTIEVCLECDLGIPADQRPVFIGRSISAIRTAEIEQELLEPTATTATELFENQLSMFLEVVSGWRNLCEPSGVPIDYGAEDVKTSLMETLIGTEVVEVIRKVCFGHKMEG